MGFLSILRRLFTYLMSLRTSDKVVPPMNHLLFGTPGTDRSYPMDAAVYHDELLKYVHYSEVDLTLQSCVTRVELCKEKKNLEHEYLVAHVVYWLDGQPHDRYKSFAVIGPLKNGRMIFEPSWMHLGHNALNIRYRKRQVSVREVCASMDFDPSVPGNLLPFERLTCMQVVAKTLAESYNITDKTYYWYASWIWDVLLLSKDLTPTFDDNTPRSHSLGGLDFFGMRVQTIRNTGEKHPCGALVRSHNAVQQEHVDMCDAEWKTFRARVKATTEEAFERRTGLERAKARADEAARARVVAEVARAAAETRAAQEAQSRENAETRAEEAKVRAEEAKVRAAEEARARVVAETARAEAETRARVGAEAARAEAETRAAQEANRAANLQAELERLRKLMESHSPTKSTF